MQPPRLRPGRTLLLIAPLTALLSCAPTETPPAAELPELRHYIAYRLTERLEVDGKLAETSWGMAPWSEPFVDIEGAAKPAPRFRTRVKMLWDDAFFYIGAELDEPHVWATLTEHDSVIYHDNDFELFVDPDGDTHEYYELEINALGTVWDLFLMKPYRDGGTALRWNSLAWWSLGKTSETAVSPRVRRTTPLWSSIRTLSCVESVRRLGLT